MDLTRIRILSFSFIFALITLTVSYKLFYLNNFKILLTFLCLVYLFVLFELLPLFNVHLKEPAASQPGLSQLHILVLSLLPLLGCLPGLFLFGDFIPLFTLIEIVSVLLPVLWMGYLLRGLANLWLWEKFFWGIALTTLLASCWGLLEFWGLRPDDLHTPYENNANRIQSTFGNINYFAGYLVVVLPFLTQVFIAQCFKFKKKEKPFPHFFLAAVVLMGIIALHLTKSRTAIFLSFYSVMGLVLAYWLLVEGYGQKIIRRIKRYFILVLPLFFLGVVAILYLFLKLVRLREGVSNTMSRLVAWEAAGESIGQSPFFGYGPGTSYQLYFNFRDPHFRLFTKESSFRHVHLELLEILQEGGMLAFSLTIFFWSVVFFILYLVWKKSFSARAKKEGSAVDNDTKKLSYFCFGVGF